MTGPSHGRPYRRRRCRFSTPSQASCSGHGIWQMPMPVPQVGIDDLTHGAGLVPVSVVTSDRPSAASGLPDPGSAAGPPHRRNGWARQETLSTQIRADRMSVGAVAGPDDYQARLGIPVGLDRIVLESPAIALLAYSFSQRDSAAGR